MLMDPTAPDVTRVLLARHGQSEWNAVGRWYHYRNYKVH